MKKQSANHLTTVRLNDDQVAWLREESLRLDRSIGWIVRAIVDRAKREAETPKPPRQPEIESRAAA